MDAITQDEPLRTEMATVVRLVVPRALEYVPLTRVTVAGYAARLGFDVDEIEDSRIAVDELARILVEVGDGDTIDLALAGADHRLDIEGTTNCSSDAQPPQLDPITSQILGAICYEYGVIIDNGTVRFRAAILGTASRQ
jgi:serine/threonine-protein kinase RsbW